MKVLLIQIRQNTDVKAEEFSSFLRYSGLALEELVSFDVFTESFKNISLTDYNGVFIGGASAANVLEIKEYPFVLDMIEFTKRLVRENIPTLASCFGFQVAALALGSQVTDDRDNYEMGTIPIQLDHSHTEDILLHDTPNNFMAVSVHQQKVTELPQNCIRLGYSDICLHIFKVKNRNFWAFQFHPEVDKQTLIDRLKIYQEKYTNGSAEYDRVIEQAQETPYSNNIIGKFTQRILRKQYRKQ